MEVLYEIRQVEGEGGGAEGVATLSRVVPEHKEYIESTTKGPVNPRTSNSDLSQQLIEDEQKVQTWRRWSNDHHMTIT